MIPVIEGQRTFTVDEYHRMGEAGVFAPEERTELIRGVIRAMSPKGPRHRIAVGLATDLFVRRLANRASTQIQDPLTIAGLASEPEPDLVVTSNTDRRDTGAASSRPLLVIEVADSSLRFDREVKGALYAEAGIADYWIVNLVDDVIEVYRDLKGGAYASKRVVKPGERVAPLSFPDLDLDASELVP